MELTGMSVLLPVRNGESCLGLAISDLMAGMTERDELLIVDDGSQDATPSLLSAWMQRDSRIHVITTSGIGLVHAINLGIREASHNLIARADADDRYPTNRFSTQRASMGPDVALVTGDYRLVTSDRGSTFLPCALGHPFVALSLINPQRIPHPGVMFRRDAVLEAGGYETEDYPAEDFGLWLRLTEVGKFVGVPHRVVDWALSPTSISHSHQVQQRAFTAEMLSTFSTSLLAKVHEDTIEEELVRYASASHSSERAILLLRDLHAWKARGVDTPGYETVLLNLLGHPLSLISAGIRLHRGARSRYRWRKSHLESRL